MLAPLGDEVRQHFGVGLGVEDVALGEQVVLQLLIVLDDAVVDDGERTVVGFVGVRVAFGRYAVGGPAGMAHARGGHGVGTSGETLFEGRELALGPDGIEFAILDEGDACGVVSAVFETAQTFDDDGNGGTMTGVADDAAHRPELLGGRGARTRYVARRGP